MTVSVDEGKSVDGEPLAEPPARIHSPKLFVKNSLANLVSGVSTAALNLVVPPILSRYLSRDEFSAWTLVLQLATYTALLNLGTQGAVSRYVAYYLAHGNRRSSSSFVSTALIVLTVTAAIAVVVVVVISVNIGRLFPSLPLALVKTSKMALLVAGSTLAVGLPTGALAGIFTGVQRNELVAAIQGSSRLILAAALIVAAVSYKSVMMMATAFCVVNIVAYISYWYINRRLAIVDIAISLATRSALRELWSYCGTVVVWMVAMFLINGLDTAIVGRVDFAAVGVYGACLGPMLLISGIQQALFGPLLQLGAVRSADRSPKDIQQLLIRATRLSTVLLLGLSMPLIIYSRELLQWWLGSSYAEQGSMIFRPLLIGNVVRMMATPYALLLLATLRHRQVLLTPIIEGVTNVVVAVSAGLRFGAVGVAYGVLFGALAGQMMNYLINIPQTTGLVDDRRALAWKGIALPSLCFVPSVLALLLARSHLLPHARALVDLAALTASGVLVWKLALEPDERQFVDLVASRLRRA